MILLLQFRKLFLIYNLHVFALPTFVIKVDKMY